MDCPCGTAKYCVNYDPCGDDYSIFFSKREVPSLCFGTLPSGKEIIKMASGEIKLEIDVQKLRKGGQGLAQYEKRIKDIFWADRYNLNPDYNASTKRLNLTRLVNTPGIYTLVIIDGNGCILEEKIEVKNKFAYESGDPSVCTFYPHCGEGYNANNIERGLTIEGIYPSEDCYGVVKCGNTIIHEPLNGYPFNATGEEFIKGSDGFCYKRLKCFFAYVNYENLQFVGSSPGFSLEIKGSDVQGGRDVGVYVVRTDGPFTCCKYYDSPPFDFAKIQSIYNRLSHVNANGFLGLGDNTGQNKPCMAKLKCIENGEKYLLIEGTAKSTTLCKDGQRCLSCVECEFDIEGQKFSASLAYDYGFPNLEKKLNTCFFAPIEVNCDDSEDCGSNRVYERSRKPVILIKVHPNPFKDELIINLETDSKHSKLHIEWHSIEGKKLKESFSLADSKSLKIPTADLAQGSYILTIAIDEYFVKSFHIVKI